MIATHALILGFISEQVEEGLKVPMTSFDVVFAVLKCEKHKG